MNMGSSLVKPTVESPLDRLIKLSKDLEENTRIFTSGLRAGGTDVCLSEKHDASELSWKNADAGTIRAREDILILAKELRDLVLGPREKLKYQAIDLINFVPLQGIYSFKIAHAVPRAGTISYESLPGEVQKACGLLLPASELRSLVRLAISNGMFCEPELGRVAHNPMSLIMVDDERLASWVGLYTVDLFLPIASTVSAMQRWPGSQELHQTGINEAFRHDKTFFDHIATDETRAKRYDLAMQAHGASEGFSVSHTVQSYPWAKLGRATVVDVGGNEGYVSMAIAEAFPELSFEVQDLPGMRTEKTNGKVPAHLADRVKLTTHDFFQTQPTVAEAYFLRHIFHAFPDKDVIRGLRALIPALRPGARIIINDAVLPLPGTISADDERTVRQLDVLMKTVCNGREREVDDWKALFMEADPGFIWQGAWKSSGKLWFVEAVWESECRE